MNRKEVGTVASLWLLQWRTAAKLPRFSKVHWQVGFDSVPGTRIREPCHNFESESTGDCVVLRMRKVYSMSLLGRSQGAFELESDPAH